MIVQTDELPGLAGTVAMVDGGFDPLHRGHVAYFRAASELGAPVLCNVAPDSWVAAKHPPLLSQADRGAVIDAIRYISYVHLADRATVEILSALRPRYYVKGSDWRGRLPVRELKLCAANQIEIVYLDTVLDSSTAILRRYSDGRQTSVP
jgi:bifunctional ADP-heptose synthase (sugar kinase/adenylyltransferase)